MEKIRSYCQLTGTMIRPIVRLVSRLDIPFNNLQMLAYLIIIEINSRKTNETQILFHICAFGIPSYSLGGCADSRKAY